MSSMHTNNSSMLCGHKSTPRRSLLNQGFVEQTGDVIKQSKLSLPYSSDDVGKYMYVVEKKQKKAQIRSMQACMQMKSMFLRRTKSHRIKYVVEKKQKVQIKSICWLARR